jgi:pimeloyl-ACP methyl ester carboxylesterase
MFIFGRHDYYIPNDVAEGLAASHPQAKVAWLDHSGHMGFIEEPQLCAQAIIDMVCQ